jgi:hypothetical protein
VSFFTLPGWSGFVEGDLVPHLSTAANKAKRPVTASL